MEYNKEIMEIKELISVVLIEICNSNIDNCPYFVIDKYMNHKNYIKYLVSKVGSINFEFEISDWGLTITIDKAVDIYEYNIDFIRKNKKFIYDIIKTMLTSKIKVRSCYFDYYKYTFIDKNNKELFSCSFCESIFCFIKVKCNTKIYNEYF